MTGSGTLGWSQAALTAAFGPLAAAGAAVHEGRIWLAGGATGVASETASVWSSDDGLSWRAEAPLPAARRDLNLLSLGGKLLVVGGSGRTGAVTPSTLVLTGQGWEPTTGISPPAHVTGAVTVRNGTAVLVLGDSTMTVYRTGNGMDWERASAGVSPNGIQSPCLGATADGLWLVGGLVVGPFGTAESTVQYYSPDGTSWEYSGSAQPPGRHAAGCVSESSGTWLLAGAVETDSSFTQLADVWVHRGTGLWNQRSANRFSARHSAAAVCFQDRLWLFGGQVGASSQAAYLSDTWTSDPVGCGPVVTSTASSSGSSSAGAATSSSGGTASGCGSGASGC